MGLSGGAAWLLALGICLLLAPKTARAQYGNEVLPELSRDWNVRVGLWIPNSQTVRAVNGEVGISGAVEKRVYDGGNYEIQIGVGYNGFDRIYNVPILVNIIAHTGGFRYGVGGGYAFGKRVNGDGTQGAALDVLLGYQLTYGKNPIFTDLRYTAISGADSELDGFSLTIGTRF